MLSVNKRAGSGFVNTLINKLPFEAHLPGYRYMGILLINLETNTELNSKVLRSWNKAPKEDSTR